MSDKLVYINDVKNRLNKAYGDGNLLGLDRVLDNVPAVDAVEVVRCKDCEAFYPKDKNFLQHCTRTGLVVHKNDFCSGGERREKNEHDIVDR